MYKYAALLIVCVLLWLAGCAGSACKIDYVGVALPLNPGTTETSFLSADEIRILEDINTRRTISGTEPLKLSKGLSSSSKLRALKLTRSNTRGPQEEQNEDDLLQRINRYGEPAGGIAEMLSYGYAADAVVPEFIGDTDPEKDSEVYFMEKAFTAAGIACIAGELPGPTCVITLAGRFEEG